MERPILTRNTFSRGVLDVEFSLQLFQADEGNLLIDKVDFLEFEDGVYSYLDQTGDVRDDVQCLQEYKYEYGVQYPARFIVNCNRNAKDSDHLVKAEIYVKSKDGGVPQMCCGVQRKIGDITYLYFEMWFVDLTAYQRKLISSINLQCTECDIALGQLRDILNMNVVKAAVEAQSPEIEYIYSKIVCGKTINMITTRSNRGCNCNG